VICLAKERRGPADLWLLCACNGDRTGLSALHFLLTEPAVLYPFRARCFNSWGIFSKPEEDQVSFCVPKFVGEGVIVCALPGWHRN